GGVRIRNLIFWRRASRSVPPTCDIEIVLRTAGRERSLTVQIGDLDGVIVAIERGCDCMTAAVVQRLPIVERTGVVNSVLVEFENIADRCGRGDSDGLVQIRRGFVSRRRGNVTGRAAGWVTDFLCAGRGRGRRGPRANEHERECYYAQNPFRKIRFASHIYSLSVEAC